STLTCQDPPQLTHFSFTTLSRSTRSTEPGAAVPQRARRSSREPVPGGTGLPKPPTPHAKEARVPHRLPRRRETPYTPRPPLPHGKRAGFAGLPPGPACWRPPTACVPPAPAGTGAALR